MVRDSGINAFALPHNFIGINAGLLLATQREDELAGVMAHEIAHVSQRHIVRAIADMKRLTLPMAAAMIAGRRWRRPANRPVKRRMVGTMAASAQHQISFTRANEQEADRIGMQLLAKAGFDPQGHERFLYQAGALVQRRGAQPDSRNVAHPSTPGEPLADTQDRIEIPTAAAVTPRPQGLRSRQGAGAGVATDDTQTLIRELETPSQGRCIQ
jgi:predicted Zn-dependent protease